MAEKRVERAAGGLVVRTTKSGPEVLLIHDAYGHVTFPKGHLEPGETWEEAAVREIREETGIASRIVSPLGRIEYLITRDGEEVRKQVRLFLLAAEDNSASPVAQEEEVDGAFFADWEKANSLHHQSGYENWSWVLPKAKVLWEWTELDMEKAWRSVSASTSLDDLAQEWSSHKDLVTRLMESVVHELAVTAPEWSKRGAPKQTDYDLPKASGSVPEIAKAIEHTLLKPEARVPDVLRLVDEARTYEFGGVCVNPQYAGLVAQGLAGTETIPCAVVGFPLGATVTEALAAEARAVVEAGAREVDMVIPVGSMREDDVWSVYHRVKAVCDEAHQLQAQVKVILEAHFLTSDQLLKAGLTALEAGADFLKTSTGFAPSGAKIMDVALLSVIAGGTAKVKAAGGIRSKEQAENYLRFGAARLGTSSGVSMIR
ncbi:deoxyribose-phosphate aldolase [Alicyclobacillus sp. SO9]|uniref:deoxyribose-phosphate aldolase n=1 Tax=Alicyclobacillus sp. SO9 TaxID=2665646 RepID=UPI0018E6DC21|nr:deoxyribose-phosphate aldolase [Alicyclobacillus sp. SO9]QQE77341.1 deoxyribose-phosphate aldolase [Alicyclobacillus sp. SO9]